MSGSAYREPDRKREPAKGTGRGRPRIALTRNDEILIKGLARCGLNTRDIGTAVGVCDRTFTKWQKERPLVRRLIEEGRAEGLTSVAASLHRKACQGDIRAIIWWERTRGKRSGQVQVVGQDQAEAITALIGGMNAEQLQRVAAGESPMTVTGSVF